MATILAVAALFAIPVLFLAAVCQIRPWVLDPIHDRRLERRRALDALVDKAVAPYRPFRVAEWLPAHQCWAEVRPYTA